MKIHSFLTVCFFASAAAIVIACSALSHDENGESVYFVVRYDGNGSTGGSVPQDGSGYESGDTVVILENSGALTRTGFSFAGWNTRKDGYGTTYAGGESFVMGSEDCVLFAKWDPLTGALESFSLGEAAFRMVFVSGGHTIPKGTDDSWTAEVSASYWIAETETTYTVWDTVYRWAVANGYSFNNAGTAGAGTGNTGQHPVTVVNWNDCMVFCNALTEFHNALQGTRYTVAYKDGGVPVRDSRYTNEEQCNRVKPDAAATGFRLPSEDDWELAARWKNDAANTVPGYESPWFTKGDSPSGSSSNYSSAGAIGEVAWYCDNSGG